MLRKLFKYDMKSLGRIFLPLYAALIIVSIVNRILDMTGLNVPIIIGNSVFGMLLVGVCVATFILTLQRFSKNLLGNEGYLMHTLPASVDKLILSKLFAAFICFVASFIAVVLSIVVMAVSTADFREFFSEIARLFSELSAAGVNYVIFAIDSIIILALLLLCMIIVLYCCISLSMLVNKHRKAFSLGAFIVITIVAQIILALIAEALSYCNLLQLTELASTHIILGLIILGELVVFGIFYSATRYMLAKKLNLE